MLSRLHRITERDRRTDGQNRYINIACVSVLTRDKNSNPHPTQPSCPNSTTADAPVWLSSIKPFCQAFTRYIYITQTDSQVGNKTIPSKPSVETNVKRSHFTVLRHKSSTTKSFWKCISSLTYLSHVILVLFHAKYSIIVGVNASNGLPAEFHCHQLQYNRHLFEKKQKSHCEQNERSTQVHNHMNKHITPQSQQLQY